MTQTSHVAHPPRPTRPPPPHAVLAQLLASLDERGIEWLLLRVPSNIAAPSGDVDLLVAPDDAGPLRRIAESHGFVAMPGSDEAPSLLLVRYDRPSDQWLIVDVATEVMFDGDRLRLRGLAPRVLARRRRYGVLWMPDDEDTFWLLLLHCLLDKGFVAPHYQRRLRELAAHAPHGPVAAAIAAAPYPADVPGLLRAATAADWAGLAVAARALRPAWRTAAPLATRVRSLVAGTVRKPLLMRHRRGVNIALLGANGAGKTTLAAGLQTGLPFPSTLVYMGLWKGDHPAGPRAVIDAVRRPMRIWWRYARAQSHQLVGHVVIFDRYVYDARLPPAPPLVAVKRPYLWLLAHACPRADVAVVLDLAPGVAFGRKQENGTAELDREQLTYRRIAADTPRVELIDASRSPDAVRAEVMDLIWRALASRWRGMRDPMPRRADREPS